MRVFHRHHAKGFTLVEIMIVVAIIALIAAIAIPNLLRARHNANEGAAVGNMHTLVQQIESFRAAQTPPTYPAALTDLSGATPPYIDAVLGAGTKQGYTFTFVQVSASQYTLNAAPVVAGVDGTRNLFADESGVIRASVSGAASAADPPIG